MCEMIDGSWGGLVQVAVSWDCRGGRGGAVHAVKDGWVLPRHVVVSETIVGARGRVHGTVRPSEHHWGRCLRITAREALIRYKCREYVYIRLL